MTAPKTERAENTAQLAILLLVAGMAGAASFTHVHDWTMHNTPPGTGTWFGWANAIITELVPAATGIEIRRRKRNHRPVTYPMTILIIDAAVSLAAQLSDAIHTLAGGLAFALPALAFLALTKLVLSSTTAATGQQATPDTEPGPGTAHPAGTPAPPLLPVPDTLTPAPAPETISHGQLLISARMTAFAHQQATGQPITPSQLADRLTIPETLAESLLSALGGTDTTPPVTTANGTPISGSRP